MCFYFAKPLPDDSEFEVAVVGTLSLQQGGVKVFCHFQRFQYVWQVSGEGIPSYL